MAGFKFPLDAYVLAIPVTYACFAFGALCFRTLTLDPEMSTYKYYEETPDKELAAAKYYDNQIKGMFSRRIDNHRTSFFVNEFNSVNHQ